MKERLTFILKRIREGRLQEMWRETLWIYGYAKHYWPAMIFYTLLGLSGTLISLLSSFLSRDLVDIITGHQTGALLKTFCMMVGVNIGSLFLSQATNFASSWISMKVDAGIKSDVFAKMLITDWESLTTYHTGDLMTRWGSDASNISNGILNFIPSLIINLFRLISAFTVVIVNDASFAVFALLGIPFSLLLSRTLMKRMVNNNKRSAAMSAKMSGFNHETLSNIQTIKAFDLISFYVNRLKQLQNEVITMRIDFQKMSVGTSVIMSLVGLLVSYSSQGWGIYRVWSGAISYGTMTLFLSMSGTLTGALNSLVSLVPTAISLTTSAGRLMDILEMPREDYSQTEQVQDFWDAHRAEGISLHLASVGYTYQSGTEVFANASLDAHPHEIIALVGPSGEGKTTMMRLILALLHPESGEASLTAGDEDHRQSVSITPATRKLFSYVPQGNTMFSGSIAENMRNVKPDATDEDIIEALKQACAWGFVSNLPAGINSMVQERGGGLSEGQAQRLSIARALLRRSPILLLDEATSALDVATERQVLKNIMKDEYPRTCVVTTHRPTVLGVCTRVYAIQDKQCTILNQEEIRKMIEDF